MAKRKTSKKSTSSKKSSSKKTTKKRGSSKPKVSLQPLRQQLEVLVLRANARLADIPDDIVSRAREEAKRTLLKSPSRIDEMEQGILFKSNLRTRQQIMKEFARVNTFLNDYTSTSRGAHLFDEELASMSALKGAFGAQWMAKSGKGYDTSRVDKKIAKDTFEIYRRIVERAGGWERAIGFAQGKESLIGYGSENLIIAIYDMVKNSDIDWKKVWRNKGSVEDTEKAVNIMNIAYSRIQEGIDIYREMESNQVKDYDYGILFDDEDAKARRSYYAWRWSYTHGDKGGSEDVGWF